MPNRRKGAPGSFGAPLDDLLPRLGDDAGHGWREPRIKKGRDAKPTAPDKAKACRVFLLNQSLYERAKGDG
jgi:hypothetical protein